MSYGVAIVIGSTFKQLEELAERMHVWAPESPEYADIAAQIKSSEYSSERGITFYYFDEFEEAEETFLSLIDTVDLHHGAFKHDPPWSFIEVHGVKPGEAITQALDELGITKIEDLPDGFLASR